MEMEKTCRVLMSLHLLDSYHVNKRAFTGKGIKVVDGVQSNGIRTNFAKEPRRDDSSLEEVRADGPSTGL